jgi:hypothetical protein
METYLKYKQYVLGVNMKEGNHFGDLGVDGSIIFKWMLKK